MSLHTCEVFVGNILLIGTAEKNTVASLFHRVVNHSSTPSRVQTKPEKQSGKIPS